MRIRSMLSLIAMVLVLGMATACHSNAPAETEPAPAPEAPPKPIPAGSPFAKVKIGMGHDEVVATLGQPTSEENYQTGKAWIPFHYGGDNYRTAAHYKGVGIIIFSSDSTFTSSRSVIEINPDPSEPGFAK